MQRSTGAFQPLHLVGDRYQILDYLGGGESTEVYKVRDIIADRVVAMKVLRDEAGKEGELRLSREFYYLSRFSHSGIAAAYDYGTAGEHRPFFTMEFVDGIPINAYFAKGYTPELLKVTVQVLQALDSIHAQGLIHCDIKPQHIMVVSEEAEVRAKLLDFGFAERAVLGEGAVPRGTLGYVAPEVFKGVDADARADLYSLGMVLYETVTGRGPGQEADLRAWLKMQYHSEFEPPRRFNPEIPEVFEQVILTLIRREPERRPRSARAVVGMLVGRGEESGVVVNTGRYLMVPGFVGRSGHLEELKRRLDEAGRGQAGAVCICGERGVGKSRLLAEFKFLAQLEGATIVAAEPASLGARSQSLVETVLDYLRAYSQAGLPGVEGAEAASAESKFRLFESVTQRLREFSLSHRVSRSLVLLVDDLELFDPTSLEFLRYLIFSLGSERLLVVVVGLKEKRFLDLIAEFERLPRFLRVSLEPMAAGEVRGLVASLVGEFSQLDELTEWLVETTGGNPLFVIESVRALIESRVLGQRAGSWTLESDALRAYRPPESVSDAVRRRVESLSAGELEVLQLGAAAGGPFTLEFLRAVVSLDETVLFNVVGQLKAEGFLRSFVADGQGALILSSKILEAVVTERLPVARRRENHRRVALALELLYPEKQDRLVFDLAHHYAQAGIGDRAYSYSLRAGQRARGLLLTEQALGFFETALGLSAHAAGPRERIGLIETVGELREATGRYAEAVDIYTQGMSIIVADRELSREKQLLARFLRRLGLVHQRQGHGDEALNLLNQALSMQAEKGTSEYVQLLNDLGWSYCTRGDFDKAEALLTQALQQAEKLHAHALSARTLYYFSVLAWSRYDFVLALQLAERSLGVYENLRDDYNTGHVAQFIATLWWRRGELARAREYYERCLPVQRRSGDVYYLLRSLQGLGVVSQEEGEWQRAREHFAEGLALAERVGDTAATAELNSNLGMVCDEIGDWSAAMGCLQRAAELQQRGGADITPAWRAAVKANIAQLAA
ncbi:MAG: tetratricopeptide repeat protein, partial [candidate division WOR-3 bacterium]